MMTSIAPPPVGGEAEPAVQLDNARALQTLQGAEAKAHAALPRVFRSRPKLSLIGAALGLAGALLFLARVIGRAAASRSGQMPTWLRRSSRGKRGRFAGVLGRG